MQDNILRWLAAAGAYFICMIAFYINIGQDMGAGYFLPILLPMLLVLVLLQYSTRLSLFSWAVLPNMIDGLAWCSAFPLLYAWTYDRCWYQSKISLDFIVGTSVLVLLTILGSCLLRCRHRRIGAACMALLNILCLLVPFMQYAYYCIFWHCLSPASLMALYLTNYHESVDFVQTHVGLLPTLLIIASIAVLFYACWRAQMIAARHFAALPGKLPAGRTAAAAVLSITMVATMFWSLPQTSIADLWQDVNSYVAQTQKYSVGHEERLDSMKINPQTTLAAKAPGTVIVVIGESASRNYMKTYTPSFSYDDTPWTEQQLHTPDFLLFKNVYSAWSQTVPVLQRALTEQSQYNGKEFFDSASIIDVARKSGYETWWFSNQGRYGQYDSAITLVAKTADHAEWTDDSNDLSNKYDDALLHYLTQLDPTKNNFVVLHIMGSHIYYNNRYPDTFEQFKTPEDSSVASSAASYANSIRYTDYILSQIFDYANSNLNLQAMVYFSDHGENLKISHNPDVFSFDMVRIPMWVYISPQYQQMLPEHAAALRQHRDQYFTNDMLYDTICGLLNAPSDRYDPDQDFASDTYAFTRDDLTTMLGQHHLTEDVNSPEPRL
jgi:heptose-I-phosphate ethanolaminephosphotransferase